MRWCILMYFMQFTLPPWRAKHLWGASRVFVMVESRWTRIGESFGESGDLGMRSINVSSFLEGMLSPWHLLWGFSSSPWFLPHLPWGRIPARKGRRSCSTSPPPARRPHCAQTLSATRPQRPRWALVEGGRGDLLEISPAMILTMRRFTQLGLGSSHNAHKT